jgi:hypothetical protein
MNTRWNYSIGSGLLGLLSGVLMSQLWGGAGASDSAGLSSDPGLARNARQEAGSWGVGVPERDRTADRRKTRALASHEGGEAEQPQVKIPVNLLRELGAASGNRIVGDRFFNGSTAEQLLEVTEFEKQHLQAEWERVNLELKRAEVSAMRFDEFEDGTVSIALPAVPLQYREIGERFRREVHAVMGEERGSALFALKQVDTFFTPIEGDKTYEVRTESTGDGSWRFHMTLEGPEGRRVWVGESIPDEICHLTDAAGIRRSLHE